MGEPPLLAGAVHATLASLSLRVATKAVGAPGMVIGTIAAEGADAADAPAAFVATTEKV